MASRKHAVHRAGAAAQRRPAVRLWPRWLAWGVWSLSLLAAVAAYFALGEAGSYDRRHGNDAQGVGMVVFAVAFFVVMNFAALTAMATAIATEGFGHMGQVALGALLALWSGSSAFVMLFLPWLGIFRVVGFFLLLATVAAPVLVLIGSASGRPGSRAEGARYTAIGALASIPLYVLAPFTWVAVMGFAPVELIAAGRRARRAR